MVKTKLSILYPAEPFSPLLQLRDFYSSENNTIIHSVSEMKAWNNTQFLSFLLLYMCLLSFFSRIWLFLTPWTIAHQVLLSMGFFRQEYWSGLPFPPPGDLPDPGIECKSHVSCTGRQVLYHYCGSPSANASNGLTFSTFARYSSPQKCFSYLF